jgi:outer membrane immunogenic protein
MITINTKASFGRRSARVLAAVAGLLAVTSLAWGADLPPPYAPLPVAPVPFSWTGVYVGLNAGYIGIKDAQTISGPGVSGSGSTSIPGGIGGAQLGANYQMGAFVLGFEADFDGSMATRSTSVPGITTGSNDQIPWVGTLRGRAGIEFDRFLLYATAGGAATQVLTNVNVDSLGASANTSTTHGAWTAGAGLEAAITDSLSARIEYLYVDTGTFNVAQLGAPPVATVTTRLQENLVRVGINYRLPIAW